MVQAMDIIILSQNNTETSGFEAMKNVKLRNCTQSDKRS